MGIGIGTIAIADGAILAWAVDRSAGPSAQTMGYVLLALGGITVLLSLRPRVAVGRVAATTFVKPRARPSQRLIQFTADDRKPLRRVDRAAGGDYFAQVRD